MASYKTWIRLTIGIVLCAILLSYVDWRETGALFSDIRFLPTAFALVTLWVGLAISALKWQLLMKALDISLPLGDLTRLYWIATFFQNYLPSSVGGDIARLTVMRRSRRLAAIAASIFVERLTGFIVLLCLALLALVARPEYFLVLDRQSSIPWFLFAGVCVAVVIFICYGRSLVDYAVKVLPKRQPTLHKVFEKLRKVVVFVSSYSTKKPSVAIALAISVPFYGSLVVFHYLLFVSLGLSVPFKEIIFIAPIIPLVSLLPISLNGIGVAEAAFVLFYMQLGLSPEQALAAALMRRLLLLFFSLVGGIYFLLGKSLQTEPSS
jgi:uncharacterized protein (TIRG00374 family)